MTAIIDLVYLAASLLFIFGIKRLSRPETATGGNRLAAFGMLLAVVVTLFDQQILSFRTIALGLAIGTAIGVLLATRVAMTAMPQLVGFFNGMGGAASALVAWSYFQGTWAAGDPPNIDVLVSVVLSITVGAMTLTGSLLACAKLMDGTRLGRALSGSITFGGQQVFNLLLGVGAVVLGVYVCLAPEPGAALHGLLAVSCLLGLMLVLPIGGADMPVVVAFLNAMSGLAAALTGFVLANKMLIIAGSLVGASGLILTDIMCRGMNRTLVSVLFTAFGSGASASAQALRRRSKDDVPRRTAEDAAVVLENALSVIVTPGYGLAVAQAQHVVRELCDMLVANGTDVRFAIHPVAGRMPGHMNVLLAEADVPYDRLYAMDEINDTFEHTDVCLVVGANDVTNPDARSDTASPLYGMPILNCDKARTTMVIKRTLSPGYAGVDNPLFYAENTMMLFGDAKEVVQGIIGALKE